MTRMRFGAFLPPHHPVGEHPTLLFQRDLELAEHLDRLGFDEIWVGEHHSTGWETIASPELFLAAAGERTHRIKLGTGVISLPYHHPFTTAQRIVQLDHQTRGRVIFGTGPGALTTDADMLGIDPVVLRQRQDEALSVLMPLLRGETVTHQTDWFTLRNAVLHLLPAQEKLEVATTSTITPSGMKLAGKHGLGVVSLAASSAAGLASLPSQWAVAEEAAAKHGNVVSRDQWRIVANIHIAETREQAEREVLHGYQRWHNDYWIGTLTTDGAGRVEDPRALIEQVRDVGSNGIVVIGTPDDAIAAIRMLQERSGGFGAFLGLAHDWASRDAVRRSWELFARYVIPEINGTTAPLHASYKRVEDGRAHLIAKQLEAMNAQMDVPIGGVRG